MGLISAVRDYGAFCVAVVRSVQRSGLSWRLSVQAAWDIGVESLPILLVIAGFIGSNLSLQGHAAFAPLGAQRMLGMFVSLAGVRELAPIIAGSMVAAKAGTQMASQLGVMRIQEQLDALEVMAVDPLAHLVAPRLVGIMLVLPALVIISTFTMIAAAYAAAVHQLGLNGAAFLSFAADGVQSMDFVYGEVKGAVFGVVICTVSCWFGVTCGNGPEGVGRATNQAVVTSAVACVVLNYFMSEVMYGQ